MSAYQSNQMTFSHNLNAFLIRFTGSKICQATLSSEETSFRKSSAISVFTRKTAEDGIKTLLTLGDSVDLK